MKTIIFLFSTMVVCAFPLAGDAMAAPGGKGGMMMEEPTAEVRKQMAEQHEKMAACLKSDKKFSDCRDEMMKNCPMAQDGHCPMYMMHQKGKGKMKGPAGN